MTTVLSYSKISFLILFFHPSIPPVIQSIWDIHSILPTVLISKFLLVPVKQVEYHIPLFFSLKI